MDTYTIVGGGGGGLPTTPHPLNTSSLNTDARRPPHPSYTQQHYTTALGYIKLPMYQLFLWRLYLMVLRGATSLLDNWKRWALKISTFLGPNGTRTRNDVAPLKTITYHAIKTTGTLIVRLFMNCLTSFATRLGWTREVVHRSVKTGPPQVSSEDSITY